MKKLVVINYLEKKITICGTGSMTIFSDLNPNQNDKVPEIKMRDLNTYFNFKEEIFELVFVFLHN